jgi:hypothetical protein
MYCKKYNFFLQTLKYQPIIHSATVLASNCLQEKNKIINSTNYQGNTDRLVEDLNSVLCEAADEK